MKRNSTKLMSIVIIASLLMTTVLLLTVNSVKADPDPSETYVFVDKWGEEGTSDGQFTSNLFVAVDSQNNVYVSDTSAYGSTINRIQKFSSDGTHILSWGSAGSGDGQFCVNYGIAVGPDDKVYVADSWNNRIQVFSSDGTFLFKWGSYGQGNGQFYHPLGIAVDPNGIVYVADTHNHRVQKFTSDGSYITQWGSSGWMPHGVDADGDGNVYVTDYYYVHKFTSDGASIADWGSVGTGDGEFDYPLGVAVDSDGYVYVGDVHNDRVQKFSSDGTFLTKFGVFGSGDGELNIGPGIFGLAIDNDGYVYVADRGNFRIVKFGTESIPSDYEYRLINGGTEVEIITWHGSGVANIPSMIEGKPVTSIAENAYQRGPITYVSIPSSVTYIGCGAFLDIGDLTAIDVDPNNQNYASVDGVLYDKAMTTLIQYPGGKPGAYTIPEGVTTIREFALSTRTLIDSLTIPESVTTIGNHALCYWHPTYSLSCHSVNQGYLSIMTQIYFNGDAPVCPEDWINGHNDNLVIYYYYGHTGFTTPLWQGVPCVCIYPIDNIAPTISDYGPTGKIKSLTDVPYLMASYSDDLSGIDTSSVRVIINGVDCTSNAIVSSTGVQYPTSMLPAGPGAKEVPKGQYEITVQVSDMAGNTASVTWDIKLTGSAYKK